MTDWTASLGYLDVCGSGLSLGSPDVTNLRLPCSFSSLLVAYSCHRPPLQRMPTSTDWPAASVGPGCSSLSPTGNSGFKEVGTTSFGHRDLNPGFRDSCNSPIKLQCLYLRFSLICHCGSAHVKNTPEVFSAMTTLHRELVAHPIQGYAPDGLQRRLRRGFSNQNPLTILAHQPQPAPCAAIPVGL